MPTRPDLPHKERAHTKPKAQSYVPLGLKAAAWGALELEVEVLPSLATYIYICEKKLKERFDLTVRKESDFTDPCVPDTRLAIFTFHTAYQPTVITYRL
jgi:hypothetical protein